MRTDCIVKLSKLQISKLNTLVQKETSGDVEGKPPPSDTNLRSTSIIDLAFAAGFEENSCDTWYRAEDTSSDHITISFSCYTRHTQRFGNPLQDRPYALHKADWEEFTTTLKEKVASNNLAQILEAINAKVDKTELSNLSLLVQLQEDLNHAANLLTQSI
jgi:hypothetical protein